MWTAGYKHNWKKMEAAAQDRAGSSEKQSVAYVLLGATELKSSKSLPEASDALLPGM